MIISIALLTALTCFHSTASKKGVAFTQILIISVTLVIVAVPEGLSLAFTQIPIISVTLVVITVPEGLPLAFATKHMTAKKLLVRILGSHETMANASVVCTDKTSTLTQNVISVVAGLIGIHAKFVHNLEDNKARTNAPDQEQEKAIAEVADEPQTNRKHADDLSIKRGDINTISSPQLERLLNQSIMINLTAFEDIDPETKELAFVGSEMETALLQSAKDLDWENWKPTRELVEIVQTIPFSSEQKATGIIFHLHTGSYCLFLKDTPEILTKKSTHHATVSRNTDWSQCVDPEIETKAIDDKIAGDNISQTTIFYTNQMLRTIIPTTGTSEAAPPLNPTSDDKVPYEYPSRGLNPAAIASRCSTYTAGGLFSVLPTHRNTLRSSPVPRSWPNPPQKTRRFLWKPSTPPVRSLVGDGANDGPTLKTTHAGFSMGTIGTEIAGEASDVVLVGDGFASVVEAIMWGWCANNAVCKFLQFQISTNITAVIITFVSAVASSEETSVLFVVQLLCQININITDTFATLTLATNLTLISLLDRKLGT